MKESFARKSAEEKTEFFRTKHELIGNDLKVAITDTITEEQEDETVDDMIASGHFIDKADLEKKFADKPDQLAAVLRNANTVMCPVREVQLWEDPDMRSSSTKRVKETQKRVLDISSNGTIKKSGPPKKIKTETGVVAVEDEKKLSEKNKQILMKARGELEEMHKNEDELMAKIEAHEAMKNGVLQPMVATQKVLMAELLSEVAGLDMAISVGECDEPVKMVIKKAQLLKTRGVSETKQFRNMVSSIKKMLKVEDFVMDVKATTDKGKGATKAAGDKAEKSTAKDDGKKNDVN